MTTRFKDFGGADSQPKEAIKFKLHEEEFLCKSAIQGKTLLNLVAKTENNEPSELAKVIDEFFSQVLEKESLTRFDNLLKHDKKIVSLETLGEITSWLMEQYSDRPLTEPEPSSNGQ
jgi:hypothetical protein